MTERCKSIHLFNTMQRPIETRPMQNRERSSQLYHSPKWTRLSLMWRNSHPLCEECKRKGIIRAAQVTDHIVPYPVCEDFFDMANLQSLCEQCNRDKGQRDKAAIQQWRRQHPEGRGI